ncbi:MAG: hypothetical protein GWP19_06465 [Planctomycetia bacterium]|nr:hypothetical protein [Planctomycetia bacterium]
MYDIDLMKAARYKFLHKLWELSEGNLRFDIEYTELGDNLGFDRGKTNKIVQYLRGEGLIRDRGSRAISIMHEGIVEIEEALNNKNAPTKHFLPVINIMNVNKMVNSPIQQGSIDSKQKVIYKKLDLSELIKFIKNINNEIDKLDLSEDDLIEAKAEIATLEAQSNSSKPKNSIITQSLTTLNTILCSAPGSLATAALIETIRHLLAG